jgi:outer membrane protein assembly factor BamE (lipoprotein component of BamABCDE complex)
MQAEDRILNSTSRHRAHAYWRWPAVIALTVLLGGCGSNNPFIKHAQRGYVFQEGALEQIPLGASQEQVLIVLGTPSTVATVNGEAFYYISQKTEQATFLQPQEVERRVIAVYFNKSRKVTRLADYSLKDGRVFDSISKTTPTAGVEGNYLSYLFRIVGGSGRI